MLLSDGTTKIGLFHGLFDRNTLTFNPPDVRSIQRGLESAGAVLALRAEDGSGPVHALLLDPEGPVLLDQIT